MQATCLSCCGDPRRAVTDPLLHQPGLGHALSRRPEEPRLATPGLADPFTTCTYLYLCPLRMSCRFPLVFEKQKRTKQLLGSQQERPSRKKEAETDRDGRGNGGGASDRLTRTSARTAQVLQCRSLRPMKDDRVVLGNSFQGRGLGTDAGCQPSTGALKSAHHPRIHHVHYLTCVPSIASAARVTRR